MKYWQYRTVPVVTHEQEDILYETPACIDWTAVGFTMLVTTAARFRYDSGEVGLLRHIGAISELAGMRYSTQSGFQPTRGRRRPDEDESSEIFAISVTGQLPEIGAPS